MQKTQSWNLDMAVPSKLHFDLGFKKIKKLFTNFNVLVCPQRAKFLKIEIFHENGKFSFITFL